MELDELFKINEIDLLIKETIDDEHFARFCCSNVKYMKSNYPKLLPSYRRGLNKDSIEYKKSIEGMKELYKRFRNLK